MWLNIYGQEPTFDAAARERTERRLRFALGRFGDQIGRVTVHLTDWDGPRGGVDKLCRVVVDVLGHGRTIVEDTDRDLNAVIDRTAGRVGQAVHRKLEWVRLYARSHGQRPVG